MTRRFDKVDAVPFGRDHERGILIVVRDPGYGLPGQFPVAPLGKMLIPITAAEAFCPPGPSGNLLRPAKTYSGRSTEAPYEPDECPSGHPG